MSKLSRIKQKIFGLTGGTTEFGQFGSNQSSPPGTTTKDLELIQALSNYDQGWFAATLNAAEPPRIQDRNALDLLLTSQLVYLFQAGIPEWDNNTDYYADHSIIQENGELYIAITGTDLSPNTGNQPSLTEDTNWRFIMSLYNPLSPMEISSTSTETITLPDHRNARLLMDTTSGSFTDTLPDGKFDGQEIEVICTEDGTDLAYLKGSGVYNGGSSLGTPFSPGRKLVYKWSETIGEWKYEDVLTADWISGTQEVKQWSKGRMTNVNPDTVSGILNVAVNGWFRSAGGDWQYNYAVSFSARPVVNGEVQTIGVIFGSTTGTATASLFYAFLLSGAAVGAFSYTCIGIAEGEY